MYQPKKRNENKKSRIKRTFFDINFQISNRLIVFGFLKCTK
jgi:hypothetical protein